MYSICTPDYWKRAAKINSNDDIAQYERFAPSLVKAGLIKGVDPWPRTNHWGHRLEMYLLIFPTNVISIWTDRYSLEV